MLRDKGEFDEAIEACKKAISLQSDYVEPYYNLLKDQGNFNVQKLIKGNITNPTIFCLQ